VASYFTVFDVYSKIDNCGNCEGYLCYIKRSFYLSAMKKMFFPFWTKIE
jgi:hypothetical protein